MGIITAGGIYQYQAQRDSIVPDSRFDQAFQDERQKTWPVREDRFGRIWMDFGGWKIGYLDKNQVDKQGRYR